ncbi:MAG: type II secretion system secretin GspD [Caulobacter sp.]|nr:type II secretion system secretin GspD [Caulobacter sp.]
MTPFILHRRLWLTAALSMTLAVAPAVAQAPAVEQEPSVQTTVLPGTGRPSATPVAPLTPARRGDVTVNLQAVDVASAAKLVLTDILGVPYTLSPQAKGFVTLRTATPVRRADLLVMFEDSLRSANLGLNRRSNGVYAIEPLSDARSQAEVITEDQAGYGNETLTLQFVNADQMKRLFDPVIPGAITSADAASNSLIVSGTSRQRKAVRDLVAQFDVNWLRGMSFALYVPQRTDARLIAPELEKLINGPEAPTAGLVRLISMERLNGILAISAQPQYLEDVRRWVEVLDRAGESAERRLFVYRVQNGRSSDLSATLIRAFGGGSPTGGAALSGASSGQSNPEGGALPAAAQSTSVQSTSVQSAARPGSAQLSLGGDSGPVTITSDDQNNAVIVFSAPREFSVIEEALRKLDVPPVQVLIEAAITEVSLNDNLRYGVQWQLGSGGDRVSLTEGKTAAATRIFPGFSYLFTNGADIKATLNALNEVTDINVVSAPKLMVLNNQTAVLQVGDEVPVVTASAVSTQTPDAPIVNSVEYRETGVILKVTPRVNGSGSVLLDISQEVSDVAETGTSTINSPTIQQRKIATTVVAQDGQTIALGGLIRDVKTRGKDGIPLLSQIPVVGALFGNHTNTVRRTELLVLLTLRVVRSPVDAEAITAELQAKIQSAAPPAWPRRPTQ